MTGVQTCALPICLLLEIGMSVLKMSHKERQRVEVLARVSRGELTLTRAAELIGLGYRQGCGAMPGISNWVIAGWCIGVGGGRRTIGRRR